MKAKSNIFILSILLSSCSGIFNRNSLDVTTTNDINKNLIKIEHGISANAGSPDSDFIIFENRNKYNVIYENRTSKELLFEYGEEKRKKIVSQICNGSFELILTSNLINKGSGRVFISLNKNELYSLRTLIAKNNIEFESINWGYQSIKISDPDGNEMIFPIEGNDT